MLQLRNRLVVLAVSSLLAAQAFAYSITDPAANATFGPISEILCNGNGAVGSENLVMQLKFQGIVQTQKNVTAEGDGDWTSGFNAPFPGWAEGQWVHVVRAGGGDVASVNYNID